MYRTREDNNISSWDKVHWEHWELDHKMTENRNHIGSAAEISSY